MKNKEDWINKDLLDKSDLTYQVYQLQDELTEEEKSKHDWKLDREDENYWRWAVRAASQDEQRNKEIAAWDKIASKTKDETNNGC